MHRRRAIILILSVLAMIVATGAYFYAPKGVSSVDIVTSDGEEVLEELSMYVGTEETLTATARPVSFESRTAEYMISDETVVSVDEQGHLQALKKGEALLSIEIAGVRRDIDIKVVDAVKDITGLEASIELYEGDEYQLEPRVKMVDKELEKPDVEYSVKRATVAKVDDHGLITAVKEGKTTVTVKAGNITKKVKVNVLERPAEVTTPVTTVVTEDTDTDDNNKKDNDKKPTKKPTKGGNTGGNTGGGNGGNTGGSSGGESDGSDGDNTGGSTGGESGGSGSGGDSGSSGSEGGE